MMGERRERFIKEHVQRIQVQSQRGEGLRVEGESGTGKMDTNVYKQKKNKKN